MDFSWIAPLIPLISEYRLWPVVVLAALVMFGQWFAKHFWPWFTKHGFTAWIDYRHERSRAERNLTERTLDLYQRGIENDAMLAASVTALKDTMIAAVTTLQRIENRQIDTSLRTARPAQAQPYPQEYSRD